MRKKILFFFGFFSLCFLLSSYSEEFVIKEFSSPQKIIKQYEPIEISASIPPDADNLSSLEKLYLPFVLKNNHLKEKSLIAKIETPSGQTVTAFSFYSGRENLWKIRYSPEEIGDYSYQLILDSAKSELGYFKVIAGKSNGFIRKSPNNPFYLVFDSGKPFFGMGHNIGWIPNNNVLGYETYFALMAENGCNLTRVWMNVSWALPFESEKLGFCQALIADKIDSLLGLAKKYNIYMVLVLDSYSSLMDEQGSWNENSWAKSPYNKVNGGPCEKPWDFFTNEQAKQYYKNRLKYIISRWGYSQNILAFELWNELDAPPGWTKEMIEFIKSINPQKQLITTSLGYPWANNFDDSSIWSLDGLDIIDRHVYGNEVGDTVENIISVNREFAKKYKKPILVGEFGMDANNSDSTIDKTGKGTALHNSLWASALSKSFSGALNWWWSEYVRVRNLYPHYKAIRNFVNGIDWNSSLVDNIKTTPVTTNLSSDSVVSSDVVIKTKDAFGDINYKEFFISNNGDVSGGIVNAYLHSPNKEEYRITPLFHVNYPQNGKLIIDVNTVSQGANLIVYIDDKEVLNKELPAGAGDGPWKKSMYKKEYGIYQCFYDLPVEIDVPSGEHVIKLENTGIDWIKIKKITLANYSGAGFANVRLVGLLVGKDMLFWIQNKDYDWKNDSKGITPPVINGASFSVLNIEDGDYDIEWWDTLKGEIFLRETLTAKNSTLNILLPDNFSKDLACKIKKR